jgi:hypothetical protein
VTSEITQRPPTKGITITGICVASGWRHGDYNKAVNRPPHKRASAQDRIGLELSVPLRAEGYKGRYLLSARAYVVDTQREVEKVGVEQDKIAVPSRITVASPTIWVSQPLRPGRYIVTAEVDERFHVKSDHKDHTIG